MKNTAGQESAPEISGSLAVFGARLRGERERLGLNQAEMGKLGGVNRSSQSLYETGKSPCGIDYLFRLAMKDIDIGFLITGTRTDTLFDHHAAELLDCLPLLDDQDQDALVRVAQGMAGRKSPSRRIHMPASAYRAASEGEENR